MSSFVCFLVAGIVRLLPDKIVSMQVLRFYTRAYV